MRRPPSFISLTASRLPIFPDMRPFLLSISLPPRISAPDDSIFPPEFPDISPPTDTSLPLITPSLLSRFPDITTPISDSVMPPEDACAPSSLSTSSFCRPSESMYPLTFTVSDTSNPICPRLPISPPVLSSFSPWTSTFSAEYISPLFSVSLDLMSTLPAEAIFPLPVTVTFSASDVNDSLPRLSSRNPVITLASISTSFAFTATLLPAAVSPFTLTFFLDVYLTVLFVAVLPVVISPSAVSVMSSTLTRSPSVFTPAPLSFDMMSILPAYMLPADLPSTAIPLYVFPLLLTSFVLYSYVWLPAEMRSLVSSDAFIIPDMSIVLLNSSRSVRLSASTPLPAMLICPSSTSTDTRFPSCIRSPPVVRVTLSAFKKPPPLTEIPFLFATTRSALCPATSTYPFMDVLSFPVTSVIIRFAAMPLSRFLFLATSPAICVSTTTCLLLFTISPCSLTCSSLREL